MEIIVGGIPGKALFYKDYGDDQFEVKLQVDNGKILDPIYCYGLNMEKKQFEVERYFESLLPYVIDAKIKVILIENLLNDAKFELLAYDEELGKASSKELEKTWEPRDPAKWWTMLYPTRQEILQGNKIETIRNMKRYEQMLEELLRNK
ncbi:hypothetical protein [Paenibacillus humicola]|uniref:hypothetical protein n=1 Tax=Paenibacillus humicola TaxID=3110540 RepID=UPI00237BF89B|nr:hypothetical protein [Paenibacillus humicola]